MKQKLRRVFKPAAGRLPAALFSVAIAATLWAPAAHASQPVFTVILDSGYRSLTQDANSQFYGIEGVSSVGAIDALLPPSAPGGAWTTNNIYLLNFGDGFATSLAAGPIGPSGLPVLYGTSSTGGSSNLGKVFSLTPPETPGGAWTETVLYSFTGGDDGQNPAGLTLARNGVLYGVTESLTLSGSSTVFSLTPPASPGANWTEKVLYTVTFSGEQVSPLGDLLIVDGKKGGLVIYGTTSVGGTFGCGTVYSLSPAPGGAIPWRQTTLYTFTCLNDGAEPGPLVMGKHGILYGGTEGGGINTIGTVFSLAPPAEPGGDWTETTIYSPQNQGEPNSLVVAPNGTIYGAASGGGYASGNVFSLIPPKNPGGAWTAQGLHAFGPDAGGKHPSGLLMYNGVLYGSTGWAGGTVFTLVP